MSSLSGLFFGCSHRNTSRPFTSRQRAGEIESGVHVAGTYIVCLDCGKEFPYSWEEMRVLSNGKVEAEQGGAAEAPQKSSRWLSWLTR